MIISTLIFFLITALQMRLWSIVHGALMHLELFTVCSSFAGILAAANIHGIPQCEALLFVTTNALALLVAAVSKGIL
jgi:hypothetical protein